jgi:hypothetical protein
MEMNYGEIVKYNGSLGKLVTDDKKNFLFLPAGFGRYLYSQLDIVTENEISETTFDEKVKYIQLNFSWGEIINTHIIGEYVIFEHTYKGDHKEISFHPYINFKDTSHGYSTLDSAIVGAIAYKYDGANSMAAGYFSKMVGMK